MRNSLLLLASLALLGACRDRGPESGSATITGASASDTKPPSVEEIRTAILDHNPTGPEALTSVVITSDDGIVALKGTVVDEDSRTNMLNRVKRMPNVKGVRDELTIAPKSGALQGGTLQGGGSNQAGQPMDDSTNKGGMQGTTPASSTKTKTTDAIRAGLAKDKAAPAAVVAGLIISDDGSLVMVSGNVPDDATHDAILKSAKKAAGNAHVQDNLHVSGK